MTYFKCYNNTLVSFEDLKYCKSIKFHHDSFCDEYSYLGHIYILDVDEMKKRYYNQINYSKDYPNPGFYVFWPNNNYSFVEFPSKRMSKYEFIIDYDKLFQDQKTIQISKIRSELIEKTWHPIRVNDWCFDVMLKLECNL